MMAIRKRDSLVKVYDTLGLGDYAILHKAESCVPPAAKEDTIQAFLSYLLLTFGEREAKKFFDEVVKVVLPSGRLEENLRRNFKGALLERVQSVFRNEVPVVEFRVIRNLIGKVGFDVQLFVAAQAFEMGTGRSKTDAEHDAARKTLESVNFEQFLRLHAKAVPRQEEPNKTQGL
jgi:dsRNA-specific ribonuclease